jgi:hypothetical protein
LVFIILLFLIFSLGFFIKFLFVFRFIIQSYFTGYYIFQCGPLSLNFYFFFVGLLVKILVVFNFILQLKLIVLYFSIWYLLFLFICFSLFFCKNYYSFQFNHLITILFFIFYINFDPYLLSFY